MPEAMTETEVLDEIVRRIVEVADPDKVILFGSRARGEAREDSDYDLLVVGPTEQGYYKRTVPLYLALMGLGVSKDVVWWTPEEIGEWRNVKSHFINRVLREGKAIYERAA